MDAADFGYLFRLVMGGTLLLWLAAFWWGAPWKHSRISFADGARAHGGTMAASIRTMQALREYTELLARETFMAEHARADLLENCRLSAAVLQQNVRPQDAAKAAALYEEIARRC